MSETTKKSVQEAPSTCSLDPEVVDSQEKPFETKTKKKINLDTANTGTSQKNPDNASGKEEIDAIASVDNLDDVSNDETDNSLNVEHGSKNLNKPTITDLKDSDQSSEDFVLRYEDSDPSESDKNSVQKDPDLVTAKKQFDSKASDANLNYSTDPLTEQSQPVSNNETENTCEVKDVTTSLNDSVNDSAVSNFKDSDPCSEDFVLRYEDSELSELDKTSDPVNEDSSQNISNDNIIEELDKIIAADDNSNLDVQDDSEFINNYEQNQIVLPDIDKPLGSGKKSPDTDPIAAENTVNLFENKSIDETNKITKPEAEMTEEITIEVKNKIAETNISQEVEAKIPITALMGAGDGFLAKEKNLDTITPESMPTSNLVQPLQPDTVKIHSIDIRQESIIKEAVNTVLPTTDYTFNSGSDDKMDVDEGIGHVLPESEAMDVSNDDAVASIVNSTPIASLFAADIKLELKDDDQKLKDKINTVIPDSCNLDIPVTEPLTSSDVTSSTDILNSNASKNIEPTISKSLVKGELQTVDTAMDQDLAKELSDDLNSETTPEIEQNVAPIITNIDSIDPDNITNKPTSEKDANNKIITELIPSLSEQEENALLESPNTGLLVAEATVSLNMPKIDEAVAPESIAIVESTVLSSSAQKNLYLSSESVIKDAIAESAQTAVYNTSLGDKNDIANALAQAESTTKVTDQLSVDIPKFSSKKSDRSKEIEPQALQFAEQASESGDIEAITTEINKTLAKDVIKDNDVEINKPEMKSMELDLPSSNIVKSNDTKVQEEPKMSELKDIEPQKAEITQPVSKPTDLETPASDIKTLSKSEDMETPDSETPKSLAESKDITHENTESNTTASEIYKSVIKPAENLKTVTETKNLELQKQEMELLSIQTQLTDTETSKTTPISSDNKSAVIPEESKLKSPEPSTSKDSVSQEMQPDQSDEVPDMTDSLGLLAETFRSMEDGDDQEEDHEEADDDDGEDGDDDDDFDHDDESNQVPDNSEDSNVATNSETDHDANLAEPDLDANLAEVDHDAKLAEPIKSTLLEAGGKIDVVETLAGTVVEAITDIEIEENKVASDIDLGTLEQDDLKLPKTPEALSDVITPNEDVVGKAEPTNEVPPETGKLTPTKAKVLEISKPKNFVNIVELEESSSEDDIQEVLRPAEGEEEQKADDISTKQTSTATCKPVRINTSEITIKTATAESTLVIPEIRVGSVDKSKESKPKCGLEVFSLDSDDDSSGKEKLESESKIETKQPYIDSSKAGVCVNPTCDGTSSHFIKANAAILRYYDVKKKRRKRAVVCENCAYHVGSRLENLISGVKCCETRLLSLDMERGGEQLVEISDSDTDSEGEDKLPNTVGEVGYSFLETMFAEMVNSTWIKYNLATRMADAKNEIVDQIDQLEKDSKEIDQMLSSCQKATDELRNDLYAAFARPIHNLPPIDIDENCIVQTPAAAISTNYDDSNSETDSQVRRSKRTRPPKDEPPSKRAAIPLPYKTNAEDPSADTKDDDIRVVRLSRECAPATLPAPGEFRRVALRVGMPVYGMRHTFGAWSMAVIENVAPSDVPNFSICRVKFENKVKGQFKQLLGRHLAYAEPADVRLTIGTRVIALFIDWSETKKKTSFYSGVIAEVPNPVNLYRYLVFFDDGYAQYVLHADIRVVCETSSLVWEEVHTFSREFVKSYLLAYPERPMVRLHAGQSLKTEWNGKWWPSKVLAVDASLVNVYFEADKRTEWIYRGSTRLAPLFLELQAAERPRNRALHSSANRHHKNMPYVEYTRTNEQEDEKATPEAQQQQEQEEIKRQRAVAKKSTIQPYQPQPPPSVHQSPSDSVLSRVVYYTPKAAVKPHKMQSHSCSILCKRTDVLPLNELRTYNPLARPLLSGWERQIVRFRFRKEVVYRAPCGRRLRNVQELHRYLRDTYSEMSVDLFDFNPQTHCLAEFVLNRCLVSKKDLSHGKENVPVPCVNYYDNALPEFCSYNTERTPTQGVPLNTDPDFLCGCDCTDDCQDKSKCACWKLTMEGAQTIGMDDTAGYVYKRLLEPVPSGIYECNSRCKCSKTCLNRVAQHPLQLKLQVFKTLNRGWGIRALNDVPKGAFLCVYAGNLLTDATANLDGLNEGDEYLAELDYIEVVEQMKEGYEDDVPEKDKRLDQNNSTSSEMSADEQSEEEDNEGGSERSKDEDFKPDPAMMGPTQHVFSKRLRKRSRKGQEGENEKDRDKDKPRDKDGNEDDCITISDDEEVRQPSRFNAEAGMDPNEFISKKRPLRSFFGKDEACYIMDAKVQGNIGRYLNHSCTPNVFVQNVFVDTHDPRFPWVAFFALSHIKAGTELTWNYNYDIGSVPGKILYCYCGAPNCRRRLL